MHIFDCVLFEFTSKTLYILVYFFLYIDIRFSNKIILTTFK
jgi:hypothetical protein